MYFLYEKSTKIVSISYFIYYTQFFAKCQYFSIIFIVCQMDFYTFYRKKKAEAPGAIKSRRKSLRFLTKKIKRSKSANAPKGSSDPSDKE